MKSEISVVTLHFEIHDKFREEVAAVAEKLFRHSEKITGVRMTLEGIYPANNTIYYCARLLVETPGHDIYVSAREDHLLPAVNQAVDLAETKLTERMRLRNEERRHPHAVEIGEGLPKTG